MAAKCEKCGSTIEGGDFCPVCGASTPNQPAAAIETAAAGAKPAWARDIPIVNNRYVWIHWGWACLLFVGIFTVVFAASSAVFAPGAGYTVDTLAGSTFWPAL
jgi:hypothetical protein